MFESTFILRFTHRDCSEIEEQEHTVASTAREAFRAFAEPDSSEIYHRIELLEYSWRNRQERPLAQMTFPA